LLHPHYTPGSSPYAYKRKDQGPLTEGWPRGDEDETGARARPLAPSPTWTLVTPYCKRTRLGRGTNTKVAGFPPLSRPSPAAFSPLRPRPRADPSGLGHAATFHSSAQGPPGLETPTITIQPIRPYTAHSGPETLTFQCFTRSVRVAAPSSGSPPALLPTPPLSWVPVLTFPRS
jgi:hypothetical protein